MQRRQKQPQAPGSLAPERTQRHAGMPSPHPHAAPRGCPPALAGGRTGTAKTQPCSGEEALSAPHPEPAAGGGRVASLPRAGLGQPGFPRTAEPAMPAPAAPTRPPPAARAEPPRGPRRVLAGGCRSPRTPPQPLQALADAHRAAPLQRHVLPEQEMELVQEPHGRAAPAPPQGAPRLRSAPLGTAAHPPPTAMPRPPPLSAAGSAALGAGGRPCPCPSPCPSPLPSSARPARPGPALPGLARPGPALRSAAPVPGLPAAASP